VCKLSFLIYHNHRTIDTHHVSKLLRNESSGLEEEEKEKKKENEGNELFLTFCRQLNIDEKNCIC